MKGQKIEEITKGHGARFKDPPIIMMSNGSVEDFDLAIIAAAQKEVGGRVPFYDQHCRPLGDNRCEICKMPACPIADQG